MHLCTGFFFKYRLVDVYIFLEKSFGWTQKLHKIDETIMPTKSKMHRTGTISWKCMKLCQYYFKNTSKRIKYFANANGTCTLPGRMIRHVYSDILIVWKLKKHVSKIFLVGGGGEFKMRVSPPYPYARRKGRLKIGRFLGITVKRLAP